MFRLGLAALFALLTIVATFVPVPLPFVSGHVPTGDGIKLLWAGPTFNVGLGIWSAQVEAMLLAPLLLGVRLGTLSQVLYVIAGLSGWPVFYQGGGTEVLSGPTVGYVIAVLPTCLLVGWLGGRKPGGWLQHLQGAVIGCVLLHVVGFAFAVGRVGVPWSIALSTLVLWPLQGHFLLFLPLCLVTAVLAKLRPAPREAKPPVSRKPAGPEPVIIRR
jgi:biotin transport system substrate-specific component